MEEIYGACEQVVHLVCSQNQIRVVIHLHFSESSNEKEALKIKASSISWIGISESYKNGGIIGACVGAWSGAGAGDGPGPARLR